MLVQSGGHDGDFVTDDDGAGSKGDEDLAHDDVADVVAGLAEFYHEAQAKDT